MEKPIELDTRLDEEKEQTGKEWFEKVVLTKLIKDGKFKLPFVENYQNLTWKISWENNKAIGEDFFASCPYFSNLVLYNNDIALGVFHLVVKFIVQDPVYRSWMELDTQFYNEMMIYNNIFPVFKNYLKEKNKEYYIKELVPKCYLANIDLKEPSKGIVVLENYKFKGFKNSVSKNFIDNHHVIHSLLQIARFHAISYAMKLENRTDFNELKGILKDARFYDDAYKEQSMGTFMGKCSMRGVDYLKQNPGLVSKEFLDNVEKVLKGNVYVLMRQLISSIEPLSVICHGDFCRNNVLYRYFDNEITGAKLFDFQTSCYGTPGVDLAFFMYMNITFEQLTQHFDNYLKIYYDELVKSIKDITGRSEINDYLTLSAIDKNFGKLSIYGYIIVAFFLPTMLDESTDKPSLEEEIKTKSMDQMAQETIERGGLPVTKNIAEVLIHMYTKGYYVP